MLIDYEEKTQKFLQSVEWQQFYTDDSYRQAVQANFLSEFRTELEQTTTNLQDYSGMYGRYILASRAQKLAMTVLGLEFYRSPQSGSFSVVDVFQARFGWIKQALAAPPADTVSQAGAVALYGQAQWIIGALQGATSTVQRPVVDGWDVFAAARSVAHVILESAPLINSIYYGTHLEGHVSPENNLRANMNDVKVLGLFVLSGLAQTIRLGVLSDRETDPALRQSAQLSAAMMASFTAGMPFQMADIYLSSFKGALSDVGGIMGTIRSSISPGALLRGSTVINSVSNFLRMSAYVPQFAAGILGIGSLAAMLNSDQLSDDQKQAIKLEIGINAAMVPAGLAVQALSMMGAATGPAGLALNAAIAVIGSLSPSTWLSIGLLKDARDFYESQLHHQSGTGYSGNSALASLYDYKAFAATLQAVPIPFMREIIGWIANDEIGEARTDEYFDLIGKAYGVPGGMQRVYESYLQNLLYRGGSTAALQEHLGGLIGGGDLERAVALQTLWTPREVREYAAYSRTGFQMRDAHIMATEMRSAQPASLWVYDAVSPKITTLRGHDYDRQQWVKGHDFLASGMDFRQSASAGVGSAGLRFEVQDGDGRRVFLSEEHLYGNYELSRYLANSLDKSYYDVASGTTYQFVNEAVYVDYGDNPVIDFGERVSSGDRQFVKISGILSSPTNQIRYTPDSERPFIEVGYQYFNRSEASYIWRAAEWSRAWNFRTGDVETTFDMGIQVTPNRDDVSTVAMGALDDVLILGNRPVHADLGGGSNAVDYTNIGRGAENIRISVDNNPDGTLRVRRFQTGGPVWVEQVVSEEFTWSHGQHGWVDYLKPVNVGVPTSGEEWQLTDTLKSVSAIRGSAGNDIFDLSQPSTMKIIASGGYDNIRATNNIVVDYSSMDEGIRVYQSFSTIEVRKSYQVGYFDQDGYAIDVNGMRVADTGAGQKSERRTGFDNIHGPLSGIVGTQYQDEIDLPNLTSDITIVSGGGSDVVNTGSGNDTIIVSGEIDARTRGGNDTLIISGSDVSGLLSAGEGYDTIISTNIESSAYGEGVYIDLAEQVYCTFAAPSSQYIRIEGIEAAVGSEWSDRIEGDNQDNMLIGNGGSDKLWGYGGDDVLEINTNGAGAGQASSFADGGDGDDWIISKTNKLLFAENGWGESVYDRVDDTLEGGTGSDTVDYSYVPGIGSGDAGLMIDLGEGHGYAKSANSHASSSDTLIAIENVVGTPGADAIYGSNGSNVLDGAGGNDAVFGRGGNDTIRLGFGVCHVDGGEGVDTIDYSLLPVDTGPDALGVYVNLVSDTACELGGTGFDGIDGMVSIESVVATDARDTIVGAVDTHSVWALDGNDLIFLADENDTTVILGSGNKWLDAGERSTTMVGYDLDFTDFVKAKDAQYGISVDLEQGKIDKGVLSDGSVTLGTDTVEGTIPVVTGTILDDRMIGNADDNLLYGGQGDDFLDGKGGDDWLIGGTGNDTLISNLGNDILEGNGGSDVYRVGLDTPGSDEREVVLKLAPTELPDRNVLELDTSSQFFTLERSGSDLIISAENTQTDIRIHDWYGSGGHIQMLSFHNQPGQSGPLMIDMARLGVNSMANGQNSYLSTEYLTVSA